MSKLLAGWIAIVANYFAREAEGGWWAEARSATIAETIPETIEAMPDEQLKRSGLGSSYVRDIWSYPHERRSRGAKEQQTVGIITVLYGVLGHTQTKQREAIRGD